jgi:hypothetical protein
MSPLENFNTLLDPLLQIMKTLDLSDPAACEAALAKAFPFEGEQLKKIGDAFQQGVDEGWLCDREGGEVNYSRVRKPEHDGAFSIDAVRMNCAGPGHTHPKGEIDLCFPVLGTPSFDGNDATGWHVYAPGSWHVPTVQNGTSNILYFLPEGAIDFGQRPPSNPS